MEEAQVQTAAEPAGRTMSLHSRPMLPNPYIAPSNDREKTIAGIWRDALGVDRVGVDDSFFELGGDSMIALQVISRLSEEFKLEIPVAGLYEGLTIRSLDAMLVSLMRECETDGASGADFTSGADQALRRKRFQEGRRLKKNGRQ
jgi:acyl carrier protein